MAMRKYLEVLSLEADQPENSEGIRCYPLSPMAFGSDLSEGCSSYLVRLSATHKLRLCSFLKHAVYPIKDRPLEYLHRRNRLATVNGIGPLAARMVARLTDLTGITDLTYLTALPWADLFDPKGNYLLRKTRAWCPFCYMEAIESGSTVFDPLYTSFRVSTVCVQHKIVLKDSCPKCGATQPFIPRLPFLEICDSCGQSLGVSSAYKDIQRRSNQHTETWNSRAVSDLIKNTIHFHEFISLETFTVKLGRIITIHSGGKPSMLANQLGLPTHHFVNWLTKGFRPGFPLFIDLCRRLNCPPSSFLFASDELTHPDLWVKGKPQVYAMRRNRSEQEIKFMAALLRSHAENPQSHPLSLRRIAKEFGCSPNYLTAHFPEDVARIRSTFDAYRAADIENRHSLRKEKIIHAIQAAKQGGVSTSERSLKQHNLLSPAETRWPKFNKIKSSTP